MRTNKTTTLTVMREYDKICILEQFIKQVPNLSKIETLVSNFIDSIAINNDNHTNKYLSVITDSIIDTNIRDNIINLSYSIAKDIPFLITIEINDNNIKYINYINNNQIWLPLF